MIADHAVTFHLSDRPQMTLTVPAGWEAHRRAHVLLLTRDGRRVVVRPCPLERSERDMTGVRAARRHGGGAVPVRGGGCLTVSGRGASAVRGRLRAQLGSGVPTRASNPDAEALARAALARALAEPRAIGTARATAGKITIDSTWEQDLAARYEHQTQRYDGEPGAEVIRRSDDNYARFGESRCWGYTDSAAHDDALAPRLELREWGVPPSTRTGWRVRYAKPMARADGVTVVRWRGFVADGTAAIGPDGRLQSVVIDDHGQARGRTTWDTVEVRFASYPAMLEPAEPRPLCSGSR